MNYKLMMKLFIASEAVFFLSLIVAYVYFWRGAGFSQQATHYLNTASAGVSTALLLCSSFSFFMAERNYRSGKLGSTKKWLLTTVILGTVFLLAQGREYYHLLTSGLTISKNELGTGFFTLTGFHGFHVLTGIVILGSILALLAKGWLQNGFEYVLTTAGMYWHFVDVVWMVLFILIYVLPHFMGR